VDLRYALADPTSWEEEMALWEEMADRHKIIFTPGGGTREVLEGFHTLFY
jgi:hypothetical protein